MFDLDKALKNLTAQRQDMVNHLLKLDGAIEAVTQLKIEKEKEDGAKVTPAEDFEGKEPVK